MLHAPLPEKIWFYPIDHVTNTATFKALDSNFSVKIPLHPFFGCIGVAPAGGEARSSVVPEAFGGNMDSPAASVDNTIYFPVNVPGALLYMGDGSLAVCGSTDAYEFFLLGNRECRCCDHGGIAPRCGRMFMALTRHLVRGARHFL